MIIARLRHVSHGFGSHAVLDDVDLELQEGRRVGVIGRNGSGKTTLLNILAGRFEPEEGEVWVRPGCRVAVMEQVPTFGAGATIESAARAVFDDLHAMSARMETIREQLETAADGSAEQRAILAELGHLDELFRRRGGYEVDFRIRTVLGGLGFGDEVRDKRVAVCSGGEKNRLALARILLTAPELLLLDEPTNHLDLAALEWLESYLRAWEGTFLVISHDRYLLDVVTEQTIEVERGRAEHYLAPFSRAMDEKQERLRGRRKAFELQRKEIKRQEDFVARNIAGQNTKQAQSRRRMLEKLERLERPEEDRGETRIRLEPRMQGGRDVLIAENLSARIGERELFRGISVHLRRGDRVGVLGPNGTGKTTLLHILAEQRVPEAGSVVHGAGIVVDFLDQELASLDPRHTVIEEVHALRPLAPQTEIRSHLARFLFKGDDVMKPVAGLSGGEKCRVALAKLFLQGANLLFLDEPTNHLDIDGRRALEQALADYTGTVVAVSHDRAFLNGFAKSILHVHDGTAELTLGNFDDFRARRESAEGSTAGGGAAEGGGAARHAARKAERRERDRLRRERERMQRRAGALESEIGELEAKLDALVSAMAVPELPPEELQSLTVSHRSLDEKRRALYDEWERLVDALVEDAPAEDGPA